MPRKTYAGGFGAKPNWLTSLERERGQVQWEYRAVFTNPQMGSKVRTLHATEEVSAKREASLDRKSLLVPGGVLYLERWDGETKEDGVDAWKAIAEWTFARGSWLTYEKKKT